MRYTVLPMIGLLAGMCPTWVMAQERPAMAPTRDVQVTYRATAPATAAGGKAQQQNIKFATVAGGNLMRIESMDASHGGTFVLVDRATKRMTMVMPQDRRYMEMPANDAMARGFVLNEGMRFAKKGAAMVVGLKCTLWDITSTDGAGSACITDDGVMLRGQGRDGQGAIEATAVKYGPQPLSLFKPPADYARLEMPAGARPPSR